MAFFIAAAAIGGLMSAAGQINQGRAARRAAEHNARVAEENAKQVLEQAVEEERIFRIGARKQIGSLRAQVGASGFRAEGSVMDIVLESTMNAEADALNIRLSAERQAKALRDDAEMTRRTGRTQQAAAGLGAAGTIFGAAASFGASRGGMGGVREAPAVGGG